MLADDNIDVLKCVTKLLQPNHDVVAAVSNGHAILREWPKLMPRIIVLDISMGELGGIEVARRLRNSGCDAQIIFLTVHSEADFVRAAIGAGGSAYVLKSRLSADLPDAINAVLADRMFLSPSLMFQPSE
jgi:DNA-binding NarL/FixJ family response regulator